MSRRGWSTDRAECEVVVEVEVDLFELAGSCFSWNCRDPFTNVRTNLASHVDGLILALLGPLPLFIFITTYLLQ